MWLHTWAKTGKVPVHVIEHTLNTYLAVPTLVRQNKFFQSKPWLGVMFASDTPCLANMPDLWGIMRDTLKYMQNPRKKTVSKNMLHVLFMQALPCFHQTNKHYMVDEHVTVALNVLLAFMFGLYKNVNRKPHFMVRVAIYKKIHMLMTSSLEAQQEFFSKHPCLVMLAFMEYIAQITPMFWPAEYEFLLKENNLHFFFEKIPLICDEFRIMDNDNIDWDELEKNADSKIHKCSRARRINKSSHLVIKKKKTPCNVSVFLDCPVLLEREHVSDFILLAHAFQVPLHIIQSGHALVQVHNLPSNIKKLQEDKMMAHYACVRTRFISSRMFVCVHCAYHKKSIHSKFRLSMQTEKLVCSECLGNEVVSIDVMGRCIVIHNITYILCPQCCKVHVYNGENVNWITTCLLQADHLKESVEKIHKCDVCEDTNYYGHPHWRINQLTGEMESICFCYKHHPNSHVLGNCVNIMQMRQLQIKRSSWMRKDMKKIYSY